MTNKVLIVEPDETLRSMMLDLGSKAIPSCSVTAAASGLEGLEIVKCQRPSLITTSWEVDNRFKRNRSLIQARCWFNKWGNDL
jgi:CheY-like chemotaxis protein